MNARRDPDRLIHAFLMDGQTELADQVYDAVRSTIERRRQRVFIGPWRFPAMNKLVPIGLSAVAVVVALVVGTQLLGPTPSGPGAVPSASPSATAEPSVAAPTPITSPSPSPATPPLTESFTSQMHGFSVSYPEGWIARAATEPWTDPAGEAQFDHPGFDVLHDPVLGDHLFLYFSSHPIGDLTPDEWVAEQIAGEGCAATEPIAVDGATGLIGADDCASVAVTTAGRGYRIALLASDDDPSAVASYDRAWFKAVLATVQLQPEDAIDVAPTASP